MVIIGLMRPQKSTTELFFDHILMNIHKFFIELTCDIALYSYLANAVAKK